METTRGSLSSQKQILLQGQGTDRLSDQPDCVLLYILSFLKTKDVVRTSVLSRRWQYLWTRVANIDLEYSISYMTLNIVQCHNMRKCFLEFIDRLFILHHASNIREIRLKFSIYVENFRLNRWIYAAMKHKVQYLDLHFDVIGRPILPLFLFHHHTLVVLKLNVECTLYTPVGAHFLHLKKMYLSRVRFMDDLSLEGLFSNCPVLDELAMVHCDWENIQNVTISIYSLRNLTIEDDTEYECISGHINRQSYFDSHVKVNATNLTCLTFASCLDINFGVSSLRSLEAASIFLPYDEGVEDKLATRALRLFSQINNVEKLTLFSKTVEALGNVEASLARLPTFYNLTQLTVDWILYFECCEFLLAFLDKMPKLEYLHLSQGCDSEESEEDYYLQQGDLRDMVMQKRVPTCFNSSLTTFAIGNFAATLLEILTIEYVLRYATRLESLFISGSKSYEKYKFVSEAKEHLLKVPRGSESCNVVFSFY